MKTNTIFLAISVLFIIISSSCSKEYNQIEGLGSITTQILEIDDFSAIKLEGADNVDIQYGPVQQVVVTGHPNIISLIKRTVRNGKWDMGLEKGNYGRYELRYSVTLPELSAVEIIGSSNVHIQNTLSTQDFDLLLMGSGSFYGFNLISRNSYIDIVGSGNCEITTANHLEIDIEGSGSVFYKGSPVIRTEITGSGTIVDAN